MAPRQPILAGKTVILLQLQDTIDSGLAQARKKINKFASGINKISFELFTGGLATGLVPAKTLKDFKDLDDRLLFLSTKLNVTDQQMETVTKRIRDLGRTTSFTASEVADGAAVLAQAGLDATQVMDTLQATLDLARGNAITLEQSGAILANTMTVFNIAGSRAGEVASQFTRAARLGTLDVLDLKESLKEVVGTLDTLNIDLPTSLALVTQLAQSSLKGTKAGTSLNTALLQLASKKDVLKNTLGIGIEDAEGNLRPILDVLDELLVRLNGLGDVSRLAVVQRIFNIRGGRAVTGLLRDLGNVRNLAKDIRTAGNEARDAAKKMDSGFGGAIRIATSALGDLSITIGKIVAGPLTTLLKVLTELTNAFEKVVAANPELVLGIAAIPPALIGIGATGLVASFALNKLGGAIGLVGAGFQFAASTINKQFTKALVGALVVQRQFFKAAKSADTGLSALLLTPQKVGGRGRGANKIKPTSFFGRVGNANVSVGKGIAAGLTTAQRALANFGNTYFNVGAFKYAGKRSVAKLIPIVNSVGKTLAKAGNAFDSFGSRKAAFTAFDVGRFFANPKGTVAAGQKLAAVFGKVIRTAAAKLPSPLALSTSIAKIFGENAPLKIVTALVARFESLFSVVRKLQALLFFTFSNGFTKSLFKVGNALAALIESNSGRGLLRLGTGIKNLFGGASRSFFGVLRLLTKVDYVRILFNVAKAGLSIAKVFASIGAITFRTLTTLSGWGNILTFLLIFGPQIKFIREAFERLGNGIVTAFRKIVAIGAYLQPTFQLIASGFKSIIVGEGGLGLNQITEGFSLMVNIIGNELTNAWNSFTLAISPAYDFMRKLIASTIELGGLFAKLFGQSVGQGFSTVINSITGGLGGGGSGLSGLITDIFNSLNMREIFTGIGAFFTGIAQSILSTIQFMANAVVETMIGIQRVIATVIGSKLLDPQGLNGPEVETLRGSAFRMEFALRKSNKVFEKMPEAMQKAFQSFVDGLENIFKARGLGANSIIGLNNAATTELDLNDQAQAAANAAAKREQQRVAKDLGRFAGTAPLVSGSITGKGGGPSVLDKLRQTVRDLSFDVQAARAVGNTDALPTLQIFLKGAREDLANALRDQRLAALATGRIGPQQGNIKDVVAATVGSIQSTRFNRLKVAAEDPQREQVDLLQQINAQLGPSSNDSYLKKLTEKAGPLTFTK